jgi:hypothetical protein
MYVDCGARVACPEVPSGAGGSICREGSRSERRGRTGEDIGEDEWNGSREVPGG